MLQLHDSGRQTRYRMQAPLCMWILLCLVFRIDLCWRLLIACTRASQDSKVGKAKLDDDLDDYFAQKDKMAAEKAAAVAVVADAPMAEAEAESETVAS